MNEVRALRAGYRGEQSGLLWLTLTDRKAPFPLLPRRARRRATYRELEQTA